MFFRNMSRENTSERTLRKRYGERKKNNNDRREKSVRIEGERARERERDREYEMREERNIYNIQCIDIYTVDHLSFAHQHALLS